VCVISKIHRAKPRKLEDKATALTTRSTFQTLPYASFFPKVLSYDLPTTSVQPQPLAPSWPLLSPRSPPRDLCGHQGFQVLFSTSLFKISTVNPKHGAEF
jgi:hypothetical protein